MHSRYFTAGGYNLIVSIPTNTAETARADRLEMPEKASGANVRYLTKLAAGLAATLLCLTANAQTLVVGDQSYNAQAVMEAAEIGRAHV